MTGFAQSKVEDGRAAAGVQRAVAAALRAGKKLLPPATTLMRCFSGGSRERENEWDQAGPKKGEGRNFAIPTTVEEARPCSTETKIKGMYRP